MRFGKTYTGILIIQKVLKHIPSATIVIIVPSIAIIDTWIDNLEIHGLNGRANIRVVTAHQVLNAPNDEYMCTLKIVDEIHKFISDERFKIITGEKANSKFFLGLTGTLPSGKLLGDLTHYIPVVDVITEQEAIDNNWISDYTEYNLGLELGEEDKLRYIRFSEPIHDTLALFKNSCRLFETNNGAFLFKDDYEVIQSCATGKAVHNGYIQANVLRNSLAEKMGWSKQLDMSTEYGREREDIWNPIHIETRVKTFVSFVRRRTDIIHNNVIKLNAVLDIYSKFPNRTICFNESIMFAERVKEAIIYTLNKPAISYHSKTESDYILDSNGKSFTYISGLRAGEPKKFGKKKILEEMLNGMRTGKYNFLSTARALDEGIDIPNLEQIITTAGSANPIQYSQRKARAQTVDIYNPGKIARIINLYFDDFVDSHGEYIRCRDKQKLRARQRLSDSNAYWVEDINDIK